jgi:hypothetical protein
MLGQKILALAMRPQADVNMTFLGWPRDIPGFPECRVDCGGDRLHYVPTHHLGFRRRRDGRFNAAQRDHHPAAISVGHRCAGRLSEIPCWGAEAATVASTTPGLPAVSGKTVW